MVTKTHVFLLKINGFIPLDFVSVHDLDSTTIYGKTLITLYAISTTCIVQVSWCISSINYRSHKGFFAVPFPYNDN